MSREGNSIAEAIVAEYVPRYNVSAFLLSKRLPKRMYQEYLGYNAPVRQANPVTLSASALRLVERHFNGMVLD